MSSLISTSIIKFADDTVVLVLISNTNEIAWMRWRDLHHGARTIVTLWKWAKLKSWLWTSGRRQQRPYTPLMISWTPVERVSSFKYLGVNISENLTWNTHIQTQVNKARQRLYICDSWGHSASHQQSLKTLYSGAIESVLTQCNLSVVWETSPVRTAKPCRVVRLAERISGSALSSLQDIYLKHCKSHWLYNLFILYTIFIY